MKPSKQNSINNWLSVYLKYIFIKIINKINSISVRNKYIKERLKGLRLKLNYSNGMTMIIPYENLNNSFHPFSIYYEYLSELKKYYSEFKIDESDTCIDIGGHVGFLLVPIMIENPKIIYFCFEADKNNYNLLQDNILLNAINTRMISVKNVAISDIDGEQEFIEGKTSTTGRLETIKSYKIKNGKRSYFGKNGKASVIKSARLDSIYKKNNITYCQLLKIDIEGGEYLLFKGGMNFLKHTKYMVIELHPVEDYHSSEIINEIQKAGFTIKTKHYKNGCSILYCNNLNLI